MMLLIYKPYYTNEYKTRNKNEYLRFRYRPKDANEF